ncbi:ABC transporter permease [Cellulomonas sp. URHB0016]
MSGAVQELVTGAVATGTVLLFPAVGELIGERSGVINLGTEGGMLAGAMAGIGVAIATGDPWLGVLAGIVAGALCGALHAFAVVRWHANQLASGLVVWFLVLGVTSVLGASFYGQVIEPLGPVEIPLLSAIPVVGPALFAQNVLVYLGYLVVPLVWWWVLRTRSGLTLRATGERPQVVVAAGHHPARVRLVAVTVGGAFAGLGGVMLTVGSVGNWSDGMTNGYGFVAVAIVSFARWNPFGVMAGAYMFGLALAAATVSQANGLAINQYLLDVVPYVLTVVVLVLTSARGRSVGPESLRNAIGAVT